MSTADRRRREKEAVRVHLLATAWRLFAGRPGAEVTMRVIAEAAEYSPRTLYLYFADREALLAAVVEEAYRQTAEALPSEEPGPGAPPAAADLLRGQARRHVARALGEPRLYETLFYELWRPGAAPGPHRARVEGRMAEALRDLGWGPGEAALGPVLLRAFTMTLVREGLAPGPEADTRTDAFVARLVGPA